MSIITARERLTVIANDASTEIGLQILEVIETEMFRAPPIRVASRQSSPLTKELRQRIKRCADKHPNYTFHKIGTIFNVSAGRVSETLNDVYPKQRDVA